MLSILQNIVFSLIFIFLLHMSWNYIRDTYSTRKTKDLVKMQTDKYQQMVNELTSHKPVPSSTDVYLNESDKCLMQNELDNLLSELQ